MQWIERKLFPDKVAKREQEEANKKIKSAAEEGATDYIKRLPPLAESPIIVLDEKLRTSIQVYEIEGSSRFALIIPGYNSGGQSPKYDKLISDLNRNGVSVARASNLHEINLQGRFEDSETYTKAHQKAYVQYMSQHLGILTSFMNENGIVDEDKEVHIIASSAGASAVLALPHIVHPLPRSLTLLGPSGDASMEDIVPSLENYLASEGRIHVLSGQNDLFRGVDPYISLKALSTSYDTDKLSVSIATNGNHGLDNFVSAVSLAMHRESFRSVGLPYGHFDEICGDYPYIEVDN